METCEKCRACPCQWVAVWDEDVSETEEDPRILCTKCAIEEGYCTCCGGFYGAEESFDPGGKCPYCHQKDKEITEEEFKKMNERVLDRLKDEL